MPHENAKLIKQAVSGDSEALEEVLSCYEKRVYNIAYRVMGNETDAQDAAQEALTKVYLNIGSFGFRCAFSSWVYKLTVNTCIDLIRKNKYNTYNKSIELDSSFGNEIVDKSAGSNPEDFLHNLELLDNILSELYKLKVNDRIAIVLKDIQGFTYQEISEITGVSVGAVKSRLFRGRERLKKQLKNSL
ncbi:MAG: sigma-70 family RNA polymerase sigma factor [Eubacteriales bacterium]